MAKTHGDSRLGEENQPTSRNPGDNSFQVTDPLINSNVQRTLNALDGMPGKPNEDGSINWLGSSYSGVDIKVIAHLYGQVDNTRELSSLDTKIANLRTLIDALNTFVSAATGLSSTQIKSSYLFPSEFIAAGGLNEGEVPPGYLAYHVPLLRNPLRTVAEMRIDATTLDAVAKGYEDRRNKLQELSEKASSTITLATLQTISVQTFREKEPIRAFGKSYPKGYTRGPRTIAGSMIFTLFNEHALAQLIRSMVSSPNKYGEPDADLSALIADQLPPLDLTIAFANEYGSISQQTIYGVEFVNDGVTLSIEDLLSEEVIQFVALDVDVMTSKGNVRVGRLQRGMHHTDSPADQTGSGLLLTSQEAYNSFLERTKIRRKLSSR